MFQFEHSELLFLLIIIPLIVIAYWLSLKRRKRLLKDFGEMEIIEQLMPERSKSRPVAKLILLLSALFFFIFG
jgi:Ca-activated chloride channel family protein